jgi:hypothetical protein
MHIDDIIAGIIARVATGEITEEEGRRLAQAEAAAAATGQSTTAITKPEPPKADPCKAEPVEKSDVQLLVDALMLTGASEAEAMRTAIRTDPATQAEVIEAERNRQQRLADRAATERYENSPEGKLERGQQRAAERAERLTRVPAAEELLREAGMRDDDLASLSADEKLVMSGLEEAPKSQRESTSRMLPEGADLTAAQAARELAAMAAEGGESQ